MTEEEKPFMCPELGCGMSFTNEDHLSVHLRKHDMSLALNLSAHPGVFSPLSLFTDQTPTPTKFLKNCEEIGLFQELSKSDNPFDDSFKKANLLDPLDQSCEDNQTDLFHGQLETPQPPPTRSGSDGVTEGAEGRLESVREIGLSSILPKKRKKFLSQSSSSMPTSTTSDDEEESLIGSSSLETQPSVTLSSDMQETSQESVSAVSSSTVDQTLTIATTTQELVKTVNPPALATSTQAQQQQNLMVMLMSLPNGQVVPIQIPASQLFAKQPQQTIDKVLPVASSPLQTQMVTSPPQVVPQQIFLPASQQVVPSPPNTMPSVVQVTPVKPVTGTQLTNIPVHVRGVGLGASAAPIQTGVQVNTSVVTNPPSGAHIGVNSALSNGSSAYSPENTGTPTNAHVIRVSPSQKNSHKSSGSQPYTKQRLKAVLQSQLTPSSGQKISKIFQQVQEIKQEPDISPTDGNTIYTAIATNNSYSPMDTVHDITQGGFESEDSESRRLKFLERNRAAAARCRQKRKHWVVNLEHKADELTKNNTRLSDEIKQLRHEVCQLKTLLLAHKDCPVTQQQRALGQLNPHTFEIQSTGEAQIESPLLSSSQVVSNSVSQTPTVISLEEVPIQNGSISVDMVPNIVKMELPKSVQETPKHLGVITGANSMSIIPKILNLEHLTATSKNS